MSIFSRTLAPVGLVLAIVFISGCAYSQDQDVFASRPQQPTTITLIDTLQKKALWSMDIPVGQELVIDYNGHHLSELFTQPPTPGTRATWELYPIGAGFGADPLRQGSITLNGDPIRALISYRQPQAMPAANHHQPQPQPRKTAARPAPRPAATQAKPAAK